MRKEYDFTRSKKNPYAKRLKQQVTILLDRESVTYFKDMAEDTGVPYQVLINLFLKQCAQDGRRLAFSPSKAASKRKTAKKRSAA